MLTFTKEGDESMNIIIILFLISSIIIIKCLKKLNMLVALRIYLISSFIILLLYSIISEEIVISSLSKLIIPNIIYEFLYSGLNNNNYVFAYIAVLSFITVVQIIVSIFIIEKKILSSKYKVTVEIKNDEINYGRKLFLHEERAQEKNIHLNKVYIDLCRMIN